MKNIQKGILIVVLCMAVLLGCVINTSATKYVRDVIAEDYKNSAVTEFLKPGDYDGDGKIDDADCRSLHILILNATDEKYDFILADDSAAIYSDANGDGIIDIRDLVLQDEYKDKALVSNGALQLNGNSAYGGEVLSNMGTGAEYAIEYTYKEGGNVNLKLNGIKNLVADSTNTETDNGVVTVKRNIKTPLKFAEPNGIELQVVGEAQIESFSVTRINMDNEIADKQTW